MACTHGDYQQKSDEERSEKAFHGGLTSGLVWRRLQAANPAVDKTVTPADAAFRVQTALIMVDRQDVEPVAVLLP